MQSHTCLWSAFTLSMAMASGAAALAADLPKEGKFTGTLSSYVTYKVYPVGKERILVAFDENGLTVGTGFLDHMTLHCFGLAQIASGMGQHRGNCIWTDPDGDQIVDDFASDGNYPANLKNVKGSATLTSGTGKYAGITGSLTYVLHYNDFRSATEGTSLDYGNVQSSYKLP